MARPAAAARLMIVLAFLAVPALAQEPPPGLPWIESYGVADYQGHKQNWDVAQGPDGLLYVAGGSSLLVFDGVDWRRYGTPNNGRIRSFQVADDGRIWVGSEDDFGWFERDAAGGLAFHSLADRIPASQRPFGDVRQVVILDEQVIFQTTGRLFHWADGKLSSRSPWGNRFRIVFVHNGRLFVLVDDAIYPLDGFDDEAPGPAPDPRWPLAPGTQATFLLPWDGDTLLLGTYADGLFLIDSEGPRPFNDDAALATAWPYTAERMADGSLAVGTIHGGLFQLDATGRVLVHLDSDNGLPVDTTLGLGLDHQGGLWLSQENAITRIALASPLRRYGESFGLTDVEGIARVDGHWMFAGSGGLAVHDPGAGELRFLDVPQNELFGLLATASGVLLAGSNGVYQVDIDFEAPAVLAVEPVFEDTFSYDVVASRHRPVVYVGTESGLGLIERVDGRWVNRGLVPGVTQRADTIAEDGDGRVWVGTGTGVVQALEWGAAQVPEVTLTLDAADGVPAGNAWVFSFGDDVIFATTEGGYRLSADTPPRLEPDPDFGNEWFVEEKDVFRFFSPDGERAVAIVGSSRGAVWYGERGDDGRLSWDHRAFAHLGPGLVPLLETTADGTLWVAIHPDTHAVPLAALAQADYPTSRLLLRRAGRADGESPLFAGIGPETVAEALPFASSALRFEYALASFVEPEQSEYRVRLVGLDDAWSPWSPETMRDYTNLAGGAYRFDVEARDARGVVAPVASLSFSIAPPWYLSPLAKVGYAALAILLLLAAAQIGQRIRNRRLLAEQRRLEGEVARRTAEVRAQAREIEALGEARARFFANVSHEFRTPLTLTRGPLRELAAGRAGALDDTARDHVALALRNTEAMESLIGQVLDINRLEVGRMPLRLARGDLAELVRRVAGRFELEARRRAIVLELTGTEDPLLVDFDPDHVDTILANLLSNALKFTPADGRVALTLAHDDQTATLTVADTGPGIDGEDPERVFERYVQGSATDPTHPGTGIGLALVKELTELHRGMVRLETRPGAGAIFAVTLPLEGLGEASSAAPPVATRDPEAATGAGDAAAVPYVPPVDPDDVPTLLIVDDNDELRAFLRLRLQSSYRIVEAADGEAGLAVARAELPDAIVSDVMMPKRDGLGLTAALKADPETDFIPILLLTAKDLKRDVVAGLEQGADDYLGKPFDTAELAARVAGLIASRRRLRERLSELETPAPAGVRDRFLERAQDALREHLSDPGFGINDWAQLLHMDRTTLYRKLKAEAGTTPEKLLRETRLELAARLLRKGVGNVGEVADSVGFASISHFSRTFKARFGQTPAAWRQAAG